MENSGYNLRQRPFPISTTFSIADSLATIATSSASTMTNTTAYPATGGTSSLTSAFTMASLCQETLGSDSAQRIGIAAKPMDPAASSGEVRTQSSATNVKFSVPAANVTAANVTVSPVLSVLT